jgi:anti-sigma factor ChrR (cupin superfamily)
MMIMAVHEHPETARLAAFGLGQLSETESVEIERHLTECIACTRAVAEAPPDGIVALLRDKVAVVAPKAALRLHAGNEILE